MISLSPSIKSKIERFQNDRLKLLSHVRFSDILKSRSFLSGEISNVGDFVYHKLDEYVNEQLFSLNRKLIDDLKQQISIESPEHNIFTSIGYYTYDPNFEEKWNQVHSLFVIEFMKQYVVHGKINWRKLDSTYAFI